MQRRIITTLVATQVLGGVGLAAGIAVMALLTRAVANSDEWAGLGTTFQVLGGALIAIPVSRVMAVRGRRPGLMLGYALAIIGVFVIIGSAHLGSLPGLLAGSLLFGGATTANSQARFAGADLAEAKHRGRDLSLVVWATTIGSVAGPNLIGPGETLARWLRLPALTGSFVFSLIGFALAAAVLAWRLRPDPLLLARELALASGPAMPEPPSGSSGAQVLASHPMALLGVITMALGHTVMVATMVMTPLHMDHGGASLQAIGFVISVHILGMYAFSPLTGAAVDKWGGRSVAVVGAVGLLTACLLAATSHQGMSGRLTLALFLLGLGWSGTMVSGSTMLTNALTVSERARAQGLADVVMGLAAAGGGAVAGVVLAVAGFDVLALGAGTLTLVIIAGVIVLRNPVEDPA